MGEFYAIIHHHASCISISDKFKHMHMQITFLSIPALFFFFFFIIADHSMTGQPIYHPSYLYLFMNSSWNLTMEPTHSVPGARKVVRKCSEPSFWPKPLPGTTHTPVASSRRML